MQVYIVRHGIAEDGEAGMPDGSRALTDKGRRRFRKTARAFARLGHELDLILTSPLVRAVQTAEILAGAVEHRAVAVLEELDPKFEVAALRTAAAKRARKATAIALVGHEPQLSGAIAAFCGVDAADLDLKKGAIVRLDLKKLDDKGPADGRWWLKPRSGGRAKGLPYSAQAARRLRTEARGPSRPKAKRKVTPAPRRRAPAAQPAATT
jgi:phosphohistidine phosphatase